MSTAPDRTRPEPGPAFRWRNATWGAALECAPLAEVAQHVFTTRQLGLRAGEPCHEAWADAVNAIGGHPRHLARVHQVHGADVSIVQEHDDLAARASLRPPADALVSIAPGAVLAIQIADCVPLLMADPRTGAVAAVHAGWRGTCAGVAPAALAAMHRLFGTDPVDVVAAIGPSIGACCYEVGREVRDAFRAAGHDGERIARWFESGGSGRLHLDLWAANRDQLCEAGVAAERIHLAALCTRTHHELFCSYRAEGLQAGRMAALIRAAAR